MANARLGFSTVALLAAVALMGCEDATREGPPPMDARDRSGATPLHPVLSGTVGEFETLSTNQDMKVEGYGLVAELPNTGSDEMPPEVRNNITEDLLKYDAGKVGSGLPSPEAILSSKRVAAVEVRGIIPALAPKGTLFDLTVNALPGSQTSSLKYGILWPTDLMLIGLVDHDMQSGKMADGRGPIYIEFLDDKPAATNPDDAAAREKLRNTRKARVIGGGMTTTPMPTVLQLYNPSYHYVQSMMRLINFKFQENPAQGSTASLLILTIPRRYAHDPRRFVDLCRNLYLAQESPGFVRHKAMEIIQALKSKDPAIPFRQFSLALEGLGTETLTEFLRPNYLSSDPIVRYATARAGAALNDVQGIVVLESIANDPGSTLRIDAINELAITARVTGNPRAMMALTDLLDSENTEVRKAAYRGLVTLDTPAITRLNVPRKFDVDVVESSGPPLIYVTQSGLPRIALIGHDVKMAANTLYVSSDQLVTVDSKTPVGFADWVIEHKMENNGKPIPKGHSVVLYYRGAAGTQSITLTSTASLGDIILRLAYSPNPMSRDYDPREVYAGLSYQRIVEMMYDMVQKKSIDAGLYIEPAPPLLNSINDLAEQARPEGLVYSANDKKAAATPSPNATVSAKDGN